MISRNDHFGGRPSADRGGRTGSRLGEHRTDGGVYAGSDVAADRAKFGELGVERADPRDILNVPGDFGRDSGNGELAPVELGLDAGGEAETQRPNGPAVQTSSFLIKLKGLRLRRPSRARL